MLKNYGLYFLTLSNDIEIIRDNVRRCKAMLGLPKNFLGLAQMDQIIELLEKLMISRNEEIYHALLDMKLCINIQGLPKILRKPSSDIHIEFEKIHPGFNKFTASGKISNLAYVNSYEFEIDMQNFIPKSISFYKPFQYIFVDKYQIFFPPYSGSYSLSVKDSLDHSSKILIPQ
jgi:hypothetical protein